MYHLRRRLPHWVERQTPCCFQHVVAAYSTVELDKPKEGNVSDEPMFIGAYTPVTKKLWEHRLLWAQQNQAASQEFRKHQYPVPSSKPAEVTSIMYPFSKDKGLVEMYRNPWGFVRIGRILEDLDSLAGTIAFSHCQDTTPGAPPPLLVTAAVDAIEAQHPLLMSADMHMRGQVVWTGRTALDIRMELMQEKYAPVPSIVAMFSFVSLDPETKKPCPVPMHEVRTPEEEAWSAERALVATQRKALRMAGGDGLPKMTQLQKEKLAELEAGARLQLDMPALASGDCILMAETSLSNSFICQPQQRNLHGRIFGGFLMRRAFELAFTTTYMFAGSRPTCVRVDDISFRRPVDIGDLLRFKSHVLDVQEEPNDNPSGPQSCLVAVDVEAVVSQPEQRTSHHTNSFRFIFRVQVPPGQQLRTVLPGNGADVLRLRSYWADME